MCLCAPAKRAPCGALQSSGLGRETGPAELPTQVKEKLPPNTTLGINHVGQGGKGVAACGPSPTWHCSRGLTWQASPSPQSSHTNPSKAVHLREPANYPSQEPGPGGGQHGRLGQPQGAGVAHSPPATSIATCWPGQNIRIVHFALGIWQDVRPFLCRSGVVCLYLLHLLCVCCFHGVRFDCSHDWQFQF